MHSMPYDGMHSMPDGPPGGGCDLPQLFGYFASLRLAKVT
jgi:hypothetical protein